MLFLLNAQIINVDAPEAHLSQRWKSLGCGEPHALRARDALDFVRAVIDQHIRDGLTPDDELAADLAALIIAKTGANAALFLPRSEGESEPRLTTFPDLVLQKLQERLKGKPEMEAKDVWSAAA